MRDAAAAWRSRIGPGALWLLPLALLVAWAVLQRRHALGAQLWIDEGISIGIASHPLHEIPGLLRQDGSPPVYYVALHVWMALFGRSESATHALSLLFAVLGVPAVAWAAWRPFGPLAALLAGALAATSPFVGYYADETRMYTLTFLLAALATGAYVRAFVLRSRRWAIGFGVLGALLCLTHGWGLFFGGAAFVGLAVPLAFAADRRRLIVDALIAGTAGAVIFAPWLPTQLFQAAHTAAPWSHVPKLSSFRHAFATMLSGRHAEILLLAGAAAGLAVCAWRGTREQRVAIASLVIVAVGTVIVAFAVSRATTPAWALRYLSVALAPLIVALGAALAAIWPVGIVVVLVVALGPWSGKPSSAALSHKSDVRPMAAALRTELPPGTLVAAAQPEQVPVLHYYLPAGMRYVTPLGRQRDPGVVDWRDALKRLRAQTIATTLAPAARSVPRGGRLLLVRALFGHPDSKWTRLVKVRSAQWTAWLLRDRRAWRVVDRYTPSRYGSRATVAGQLLQRR